MVGWTLLIDLYKNLLPEFKVNQRAVTREDAAFAQKSDSFPVAMMWNVVVENFIW